MKPMTLKTVVVSVATLCCITSVGFAAEKKQFPAENLFPFLKAYYSIAPGERSAFQLKYYAVSKKGHLPPLKATLKGKAGDVPITLNAKGEMKPLPSSLDLASKAQIELEAEKGTSFSVMVRIVANVPTATIIESRSLDLAIKQAQNGAKKAAGVMGFALPKLDSACFIGAKSGMLILENGQKIPLQTAKSKTDLDLNGSPCYTPSLQKGAARISLDKTPSLIDIGARPN